MEHDDQELLRRLVRGHTPAADAFWRRHAPRLRIYAACIMRRADGVEDVVQSVFCRLFEMRASQIEKVRDVPAWLATLVRNAAVNHIRSHRRERRRRRELAAGRESSSDAAGLVPIAAPVTRRSLEEAVALLPRRLAEVVMLKHVVGLTFDQIALATGVNRNTAASRHTAALRALQPLIAGEGARNLDAACVETCSCNEVSDD